MIELSIVFIIVFVVVLMFKRKKYFKNKQLNKKAFLSDTEVMYMKNAYKVNVEKLDISKTVITISVVNSLCISIAYFVYSILPIDMFVIKLLVMFIVVVVLVVVLYYIASLILKKRCIK